LDKKIKKRKKILKKNIEEINESNNKLSKKRKRSIDFDSIKS
jgi:hypothetical protein